MFRFASLSLAALIAGALVTGAQAMPIKQPNKPVLPGPQKPINFNPNFKPKPLPKPLPPVIVTPNPKFYPKPYYPKYGVITQTVVEPVYVATRPAVRAAAPMKADCLSKEVTVEGLVIFRDACTGEIATTTIPGSPADVAAQAQLLEMAQTKPVTAVK
jgi:hypothetical protein